jgi:dolichol-phosphate mannosyltransferase
MFKKDILRNLTLRPLGYRVIMEIIFKAKHAKICEVPIVFERRKAGKSKTDMIEALRTLRYITELKFGLR